ncbi:MAG: TonB family protein [Pseudomonadota bacterium]
MSTILPVPPPPPRPAPVNRNLVIAGSVLAFHVLAIWGLQSGLLRRAVEMVVPVAMLSEFIEPPAPKVTPQPPAPPAPVKQPVLKTPSPPPPPQLAAIIDTTPSPTAPTGVVDPPPPAPILAPVAVAPAPPAPPAPPKVELPSSDADYLQNPKPPYPPISKRLGEQGKVEIRVLINVNGTADKAEISKSSGYDRLDQSALSTVLRWRYVPGKRAGVPETMWFKVPVNFVLE